MSSTEISTSPSALTVASNPTSTRPATTSASTIRRKPKITYQSPSASYNPPSLRIEASAHAFFRSIAAKVGSTSSSPDTNSPKVKLNRKVKKVMDGKVEKKAIAPPPRPRYSMGPPLPLYHPLGRLALSLPELDPATLGLPPLPTDDNSRRSSARTRRPAAKLREADEERLSTPIASAVASNEPKEKASPRKKGGARPGAGMKRKRKDADEDATYPAKKTRAPRGGSALARVTTSEAPSPPEVATPVAPENTVEAPEEKKPERRSTRSRGSLLRRDSSGSEATTTSVSVAVNTLVAGKGKSVDVVKRKSPTVDDGKSQNGTGEGKANDKGEGVVAEDAKH